MARRATTTTRGIHDVVFDVYVRYLTWIDKVNTVRTVAVDRVVENIDAVTGFDIETVLVISDNNVVANRHVLNGKVAAGREINPRPHHRTLNDVPCNQNIVVSG